MKSRSIRKKGTAPLFKTPGMMVRGLTEDKIESFYATINSIRNRKIQQMRQMMPRG